MSESKNIYNDYQLIPMGEITPEARIIAVKWGDEYFPGIALSEKHKLASDIMNYARRHHENKLKELIGEIEKMKGYHDYASLDSQETLKSVIKQLDNKLNGK
jgi:hypothetical protein